VALAVLCNAASGEAQSAHAFNFTGLITGHVGVSATNDVRDASATPGASMAVLDNNGIGVEVDLAHLGDFDNSRFAESGITSAMQNFIATGQQVTWRPFVIVGAGVMRVSGTSIEGLPSISRTEGGWTAGGGVLYLFNEALGIRGDVRYFRHFSRHDDVPLADDGALNLWRTSVGVTRSWPIR
jgi:hypothetical protein